MLSRAIVPLLQERLRTFPSAVLVGPRQSGKTTIARSIAHTYFDLEQEQDRLRLDLQWEELARSKSLVILDEAQSWPEVFPKLRGAIDADRKRNGRFLLLGSVAPALMREVSESLAGRIAIVDRKSGPQRWIGDSACWMGQSQSIWKSKTAGAQRPASR